MTARTPAAPTRVRPGFHAGDWADGHSLYQSSAWIASMISRAGQDPVTISATAGGNVHEGGSAAGVLAFQNRDPGFYEAYNLGALLLRVPPVFPLPSAGEAALAEVARRYPAVTADALFPNVTVAVPGYGHPLVAVGPAGGALAAQVVRGVVELAGQRSAAACGVLYLPRQAAAVAAILGDLGFVRFPLTERAVLDIPPGGLAGYLRSLPGHRRRNVRRELRILAEAGVVSRTADPGAAVDVILRLRLTHLSSLGLPADAAAERARLDGLVRNFPGSVLRLIVSEVRGRPVACMMFARTGPVLHGVMMGVDYRHAPPFTIFEALYYAVIRAAEPGVTALDLGIGHLDAKLRRGATPRPLDGWVLPLAPGLAPAVAAAALVLRTHSPVHGTGPAGEPAR